MYIFDACMNDLTSLVNYKCVMLLHMSLYTLKTNDLIHWSSFVKRMVNYFTFWMLMWMISQVFSITSMLSCFTCPYTSWKRMILPSDQLLPTICYMWRIYWVFLSMISRVSSFINVLFCFMCPFSHWKRLILPIDQRLSTLWYIGWIYLLIVWMISIILPIYFIYPYTHWKRMILPVDPFLSTVCYIRCMYCVFILMISPVLSIICVLSHYTCPYLP